MLEHRLTPTRRRVRRRRRHRRRCLPPARLLVAHLVAAIVALTTTSVPVEGQTAEPLVHQPPVDAPIVDPFRPPAHPFGPGNRGIEYDTEPGDEVHASAAGQVVFAGVVAGALHVTLAHSDGVRTSYSYLRSVAVVLGQLVQQGDVVGQAGERLHFGARRGDSYFDPAALFGSGGEVRVELLPFEIPPGSGPDEERRALLQLGFEVDDDGGFGIDLPSLADVAGWAVDRARLGEHYAADLSPGRRMVDLAWTISSSAVAPEPCSDAPAPRQPVASSGGKRVAVLIGGLGSSSESASIDGLRTDELGYQPEDVLRFSYAGGRTPGTGTGFQNLPTRPYISADTQGDLVASGRRLAELVEAMLAERPDLTIDLYAHSMGGVVTRLALLELEQHGVDLARLGLVTTFGSPHRGADLATAAAAARTSVGGRVGLGLAESKLDTGLDPGALAIAQLAETSDVTLLLDQAGVPDGVELLSVAASGDMVVTLPNTRVTGERNVTVELAGWDAHGDLVETDEANEEVARALAGELPGCRDLAEVIREETTGSGISYLEDLGGFAILQASG